VLKDHVNSIFMKVGNGAQIKHEYQIFIKTLKFIFLYLK